MLLGPPTDQLTMQQQDAGEERELHFWPIFLTHSVFSRPAWHRIIEQLQAATQRIGKPNPSCVVRRGEENARFSRKIGNSYASVFSAAIIRLEKGPSTHYRARNKGMHILLSNSQTGPGRTVKQEQEEISGSVFSKM